MIPKRDREAISKRAAAAASKVIHNPQSSKAAMVAAGLALTQRPDRKRQGRA